MNQYDSSFYQQRDKKTKYSADKMLEIVWEHVKPRSVLDIGCGVGTWLDSASEKGAEEIQGIEGPWVQNHSLKIPENNISIIDIEKNTDSLDNRLYDLSICLEVAEHLKTTTALNLFAKICEKSEAVLFSAAIPGQGGTHHINEQWQSYWVNAFKNRGFYAYDCLRGRIWNDENIPFWYRQNIFLFAKSEITGLEKYKVDNSPHLLDVVHPELLAKRDEKVGFPTLIKRFIRTVRRKVL